MNTTLSAQSKDYERIEQAIRYLGENFKEQPRLEEIAQKLHVSEFHFHRLFQRWAGITPKKFMEYLTKEYAKGLLAETNVLDASLEAGLSGPGRLHDLMVHWEAMSPGEFKQKGKGVAIEYGFHPTPLGDCFLALSERGLCHLAFVEGGSKEKVLEDFKKSWGQADIKRNDHRTKEIINKIFVPGAPAQGAPIRLICRGTPFQVKVWEALLKIPAGRAVTYKQIAKAIGNPKAVRAVGTAVGSNPIAYLIPCHRVIRGAGHLGGYRWGTHRKKAILALEAARRQRSFSS